MVSTDWLVLEIIVKRTGCLKVRRISYSLELVFLEKILGEKYLFIFCVLQ